ncbi:hypothetical protein BDZ90DRAFT_113950 [Jaminaea rosea]|uniref:Uncharacterized protein n=1 Tax=Jaminaea rosea TaxID=1569628 RepID=A0A316V2C4_9BASI|nr:hypothetical protein BDZ90DRAFT_113950 [Jaminaea rosea]PWN29575.1 hypothetical protein BDZ90DRAFT_113950 [Jaminaea rosea]
MEGLPTAVLMMNEREVKACVGVCWLLLCASCADAPASALGQRQERPPARFGRRSSKKLWGSQSAEPVERKEEATAASYAGDERSRAKGLIVDNEMVTENLRLSASSREVS